MPFKGNRGPLILGIIVVVFVIGFLFLISSTNTTPKTGKTGTVVCTIQAQIGIESVFLTVLDTDRSVTLTTTDLLTGFSFNCTKGQTIRLTAIMQDGFLFNTWRFDDGTFDDSNALTKVISANTLIKATVKFNPPFYNNTNQVGET